MVGASTPCLEERHGVDGLTSIVAEWSDLCDRADATPFQRPEWLLPFAQLFEGEALTLAVRVGDELVALLPLIESAADRQTLALLGTGLSDHLDVIVDATRRPVAEHTLSAWLDTSAARWTTIDLQQLPDHSVLLRLPAPYDFSDRRELHEPCPVLGNATAPLRIPAEMTRKRAYYLRRAERRGRITFSAADAETALDVVDELLRLHRRRWSGNGDGVLRDPRVVALHRAAAIGFARRGQLLLHTMQVDGSVVAVAYGFLDRARAYYYIGGYDRDWSDVSPGTLVIAHTIEQAQRRGATTFDFLRGRERYKYLWGAHDEPTHRRVLRRHSRASRGRSHIE